MNTQVNHQFKHSHTVPTVVRWLRMVELHGGHTSALESLLRDAESLERLKRALRACGMCPEEIIRGCPPPI